MAQHPRPGPLQKLDARIKLIAALAFVIMTVATPIGWWTWYGVLGFVLALLIGLSGIPPRELMRRWLKFLVLLSFLALVIGATHPAGRALGLGAVAASILIKSSLAIVAMLVLAGVTSFHSLLGAMRKLGRSTGAGGDARVHGTVSLRARGGAEPHGDRPPCPFVPQANHVLPGPGGRLDRATVFCGHSSERSGCTGRW